jgi:hypothetical protein
MPKSKRKHQRKRRPLFLIKVDESGEAEIAFKLDKHGSLVRDKNDSTKYRTKRLIIGRQSRTKIESIGSEQQRKVVAKPKAEEIPTLLEPPKSLDQIFKRIEDDLSTNFDIFGKDLFPF